MKLFISWAKDSAEAMALELHSWIPRVTLNNVKTWCSADPKCLPQGENFPAKVLHAAIECDACVAILTRESLSGWWVNFETGLFFGQKKPVYAVLCGDVTHSMLGAHGHPLSANGVNYTSIDKASLASFLTSLKINDPDWVKNDFSKQVTDNFAELGGKYDALFGPSYTKISKLLADSGGKSGEMTDI